MKHCLMLLTVIGCCMFAGGALAQTAPASSSAPGSIDDDIARLRKELVRAQVDAERIGQEMEKDKKDFEAYRARTAQRIAQTQRQLDTLKAETIAQSRADDSIAARISGVLAQRHEIELSQDEFRAKLISLCTSALPAVKKAPPLVMAPILSGLTLLINDLSTRSVDNVEGCTRLVQIFSKLDDASSGIQISQESSPVPDIPGMVYRLRIGTIFEAVVDAKGEKCAVFAGWGADGAPHWKDAGSPAFAAAVLQAVNIREGKSLPAFVDLPCAGVAEAGGAK